MATSAAAVDSDAAAGAGEDSAVVVVSVAVAGFFSCFAGFGKGFLAVSIRPLANSITWPW